jgi:hypothetical protein
MTKPPVSRSLLTIADRGLLTLHGRPGTRLQVLSGAVLLTEEDRREDALVAAGAEIRLDATGRVLLEGLGESRVRIVPPTPRGPFAAARLGATVRRAAAAMRRWRARLQFGPVETLAER